mmetsp:Transcript_15098/g.32275  ORF Transcript_15098/g.32275 Transcript_15098/m.32275 type:complete len:148 (+) Transcript_15098:1266-1709(+)
MKKRWQRLRKIPRVHLLWRSIVWMTYVAQPSLLLRIALRLTRMPKKLHLSGCVVILPEPIQLQDGTLKRCNIVVLEGGEKRLQKMEKQMMNRIKWGQGNNCIKVWQGIVAKKMFSSLEFQEFESAKRAREYLAKHGMAHYWDMAFQV